VENRPRKWKAKRKAEKSEVASRLQHIHDKIDAKINHWAKFDSEQERRNADTKKAQQEKMEMERKSYEKRMTVRKADQKRTTAERKA
jgi:hypothetical protein